MNKKEQLNENFSSNLNEKERQVIDSIKKNSLHESKLKKIIMFLLPLFFLLGLTTFIIIYGSPKIKSVNISSDINGDNTRTITMTIHNPFQMPVQCAISEKEEVSDELKWIKSYDNKCTFNVNSGSYYLFIKDKHGKVYKLKTDK